MAIALATIAVVLGVIVGREPLRRAMTRAPARPEMRLDAKASFLRGIELVRAGHHVDALPYFRHALDLRGDLWQVHSDYASALLNATIQVAPHRGVPGPVSRSSWERVSGIREAFEHLDTAERLAPEPRFRAMVLNLRSSLFSNWGLFWDAAVEYRRATDADPSVRGTRPGEVVPASPASPTIHESASSGRTP
jgi:tetratricopeptide (TPR) repeat protein